MADEGVIILFPNLEYLIKINDLKWHQFTLCLLTKTWKIMEWISLYKISSTRPQIYFSP